MQRGPFVGLVALVLLAGCGGLFGGPQVVEDECAEVARGLVSCDVVVENPEEEPMTVNVTIETKGIDRVFDVESETVELAPGERAEVSMSLNGRSDAGYDLDVEEVSE